MALTVKIRADASHFKKTIAGVEVQASGLTGVMAKLGGSIPVFGAALATAAVGAAALGASLAFIKDASGKAAGMESLAVQFEVLTKSASKAADLIKSFREEAIKSPLSVEDYAQAAQKMLTVGTSAEKVLPTLKMIGDVSLGNSLKFERLSLAYSQIISKGRLMGQENNQLAESGFAPLAAIAKRTGETFKELMKRMEAQGISADEVTQAFKDATSEGGLFFGALEKGAATTEGKIAKLGDSIMGLKVSFGTGFNEGLKSALDATNNFLPQLEGKFASIGSLFGTAIKDAVNGNFGLFIEAGALIGEALKQGIKSAAGSAIVDGVMRPALEWLEGGNMGTPEAKAKAREAANATLGPSMSAKAQTAEIMDAMRPMIHQFKESNNQRSRDEWTIYLKRQAAASEELVRQGQAVTRGNMSKMMGLYPTSR